MMNFQGPPTSYSSLTPEQIKFEEEFSKWEQNFKNWQMQNQMNVNHQSYKEYEQKFLDIRDKLLLKRTQIYAKKPMIDIRQEYEFQLTKAAAAAEEILRRFPVNMAEERVTTQPANPFGFIGNDRDQQRVRDPPINNNRSMMMSGMNQNNMRSGMNQNSWPQSSIQEPLSDYPNDPWDTLVGKRRKMMTAKIQRVKNEQTMGVSERLDNVRMFGQPSLPKTEKYRALLRMTKEFEKNGGRPKNPSGAMQLRNRRLQEKKHKQDWTAEDHALHEYVEYATKVRIEYAKRQAEETAKKLVSDHNNSALVPPAFNQFF